MTPDSFDEHVLAVRKEAGMWGSPAWAEAAQSCRARVVSWRHVREDSHPYDPEPWIDERMGEMPTWSEDGYGDAVGFDVDERPLLVERASPTGAVTVIELWQHGPSWSDRLRPEQASRLASADGRVDCVLDVSPAGLEVQRWRYEAGSPARVDIAGLPAEGSLFAETYVFTEEGDVCLLTRGFEQLDRGDRSEADAIAAALDAAGQLEAHDEVFRAAAPDVDARADTAGEAAETLAGAVETAVIAAMGSSAIDDPCGLLVGVGPDGVPHGRVVSGRYRERMAGVVDATEDGTWLWAELTPPDGEQLNLAGRLDAHALAVCSELRAAMDARRAVPEAGRRRAAEIAATTGRLLSERLNARGWGGAVEPFLALVSIGGLDGFFDPYELAARSVGADRVDRFRAAAQGRVAFAHAVESSFEELLAASGLDADASRRVRAAAVPGHRLVPDASGSARTKIGGQGFLPAGVDWPRGPDRQALSFIAAVDLRDLENADPLSSEGQLLFFLDTRFGAMVDEAGCAEGDAGRVLWIPALGEPVRAEAPVDVLLLREQIVAPHAAVTLCDELGAGLALLGDRVQGERYDRLARRLRGGDDAWVLGAFTGAQRVAADDGSLLLLMLSPAIYGVDFLDGGTVQFRIAPTAAKLGAWSEAVVLADPG